MTKLLAYIGCFAFILGACIEPQTNAAWALQVALLYSGLITAVWASIASR
jgi:hypothetical protein